MLSDTGALFVTLVLSRRLKEALANSAEEGMKQQGQHEKLTAQLQLQLESKVAEVRIEMETELLQQAATLQAEIELLETNAQAHMQTVMDALKVQMAAEAEVHTAQLQLQLESEVAQVRIEMETELAEANDAAEKSEHLVLVACNEQHEEEVQSVKLEHDQAISTMEVDHSNAMAALESHIQVDTESMGVLQTELKQTQMDLDKQRQRVQELMAEVAQREAADAKVKAVQQLASSKLCDMLTRLIALAGEQADADATFQSDEEQLSLLLAVTSQLENVDKTRAKEVNNWHLLGETIRDKWCADSTALVLDGVWQPQHVIHVLEEYIDTQALELSQHKSQLLRSKLCASVSQEAELALLSHKKLVEKNIPLSPVSEVEVTAETEKLKAKMRQRLGLDAQA